MEKSSNSTNKYRSNGKRAYRAYRAQSDVACSVCSTYSQGLRSRTSVAPVINLSDIISALEMTNDESCGYLDTETGQIKWQFDFDPSLSDISSEELEADEADEEELEANEEAGETGKTGGTRLRKRYLLLPDRFEINEYHMIEAFAYDHDDHSGGRLVRAISGRGAFRRFRETVERLGLLDEWYEFRDNCYRERAVSWCQGHNISFFVEDGGNKNRGNYSSNRNGKRQKTQKTQHLQECLLEGRQGA